MSIPVSKVKVRLTQAIDSSSTTVLFSSVDSNRTMSDIAMSDFGTYGYLVVNPTGKANNYEVIRFQSWSESSGVVTVGTLTRNLDLQGTDNAGTGRSFPAGTIAIIGDNHHWANNLVQTEGAQTVAGVKTFSSLPAITAGDPVADNDVARKAYVDATATGTTTVDRLVVAGTGGEVIADGDLIYFDTVTNNEWMKCDADTAASVDNVLLGIAQGAGTDGGAITGGVLLRGVDDAQSGMTIGDTMYASNTAGDISSSAGTTEVTVGVAKAATELYFSPRLNQQITEDEQDALAGTSGTPSTSNKYVTDDDTSATSSASKIIRANASGDIADEFLNLTTAGDVVYSDGTDLTRLAIGTGGQVLKTNSGATAPEWGALNRISMVTSNVTVSNDAAETNLLSVSIPGGTLGTGNAIRVKAYISDFNLVGSDSCQFRLKYGSTTVSSLLGTEESGSGIASATGVIEGIIVGTGATNTQEAVMDVDLRVNEFDGNSVDGDVFRGQTNGSATEDSTGALNLILTVDFGSANASNNITMITATVESIT